MELQEARKIALMGRPRSGKNYIAAKTGLQEYPLGAPLYALVEHFYGPLRKSTPGFINLLNSLGSGVEHAILTITRYS
jgi:hypothetical protein